MAEIPCEGREFGNGAGHDLMRIVMVCLVDPDEASSILRMLDVLLSRKMSYAAKKDILTAEYGLPFTEPFDRRFLDMCNFSTGIFEEGRAEGRMEGRMEGRAEGLEEALLSSVRAVMESLRCSAEKAMDILKLPAESREMLLGKL